MHTRAHGRPDIAMVCAHLQVEAASHKVSESATPVGTGKHLRDTPVTLCNRLAQHLCVCVCVGVCVCVCVDAATMEGGEGEGTTKAGMEGGRQGDHQGRACSRQTVGGAVSIKQWFQSMGGGKSRGQPTGPICCNSCPNGQCSGRSSSSSSAGAPLPCVVHTFSTAWPSGRCGLFSGSCMACAADGQESGKHGDECTHSSPGVALHHLLRGSGLPTDPAPSQAGASLYPLPAPPPACLRCVTQRTSAPGAVTG